MLPSWIDTLKRFDEQRPSLPGEHWMTFAVGVALLAWAGRAAPRGGGSIAALAGVALLVRAASGRDGLLKRLGGRTDYSVPTGRLSARRLPDDPPYL